MNTAQLYSCLILSAASKRVKLIPTPLTAPLMVSDTRLREKRSLRSGKLFRLPGKTRIFASVFQKTVGILFILPPLLSVSSAVSTCCVLLLPRKVARKMKVIPDFEGTQQFLHVDDMPSSMRIPLDIISLSFHSILPL